MQSQAENELSWLQNPFRELLRLSWPIAISTVSYSVMTLVDTLLVGRLGAAQLAGVGLGGTAAFVLTCFSFGLLRGVKTLVSQAVGAKRFDEVGRHLGAALVFALGIGALTTLAGELVALFLPHICATAEEGAYARTYLSIRALGAPIAIWYVALREVRYGEGDARSPMVATVAANLVNVTLASIFVYVLKWGVTGAAWATVVAHSVEAGVMMWKTRARGFPLRDTTREHLRALWLVGMPTAIQFTLEVGSFAMLAAMVAALSETEMAAHQIALQVISFAFLPAFAVAEAASVLAGQAVGARREELVQRIARLAMATASAYTCLCSLTLALFAQLIVSAFTDVQSLSHAAVRLLHVAAVFLVFDGANMVARGTLRGTGDARYPAVVGVLTSWALTPPLTWLLGWRLHLGAFGGWLGLCAEIILGSLILWWRIERGSWRSASRATVASSIESDPESYSKVASTGA